MLLVAVVAGLIALDRDAPILELVCLAWAGFGAAFGPVVLLSLYWKKLSTWGALASMVTGAVVVFIWGNSPLSDVMHEIVPGFIASLLVAAVVSPATSKPSTEIDAEFDAAVAQAHDDYRVPETPATADSGAAGAFAVRPGPVLLAR